MIKIDNNVRLSHIGVISILILIASISPIFSLFVSLLLVRTKFFYPFFIIFSFYFGWYYLPQLDLLVHYEHFKSLLGLSLSASWLEPSTIHLGKEVYPVLFKFLLGKLSSSPNMFSALACTVYTFIFICCLIQLNKINTREKSTLSFLLFFGVIFTVEFYWFLGFRYWTGVFVFLYFYLKYITTNKQRFLVLSFSCLFFHFAHITICVIVLLNYFLKDRYYIRFAVLGLSFVIRLLEAPLVSIISKLPFLKFYVKQSMIDDKIVESVAEKAEYFRTFGNIFYQLRLDLLFMTCFVVFILYFMKNKAILYFKSNVFGLVILLLSAANMGFSSLTFYDRMFKFCVLVFFISLYIYSLEHSLNLSKAKKAFLYTLIIISISFSVLTAIIEQRAYLFKMDLWFSNLFICN